MQAWRWLSISEPFVNVMSSFLRKIVCVCVNAHACTCATDANNQDAKKLDTDVQIFISLGQSSRIEIC